MTEYMFNVLEREFSTFKEASNNWKTDEWVSKNPDAASELIGCLFNGLSESEMEEVINEVIEELENLEEEL